MIRIYNGDCRVAVERIDRDSVDCVLTSPPYNTQPMNGTNMYDVHVDEMSEEDYRKLCVEIVSKCDDVLKKNGVILWNTSYGAHNSDQFVKVVSDICEKTNFTIADVIVWKKDCAFPNTCSPNRLTRICEFVFVLVRRDEMMTFYCNKQKKSVRDTGQQMYAPIENIVFAKNNDGVTMGMNNATFSTDFARKLLGLYCPSGGVVYDPFMGTGTTASAARDLSLDCYGSELSEKQCEYAKKRLDDMFTQVEIVKI